MTGTSARADCTITCLGRHNTLEGTSATCHLQALHFCINFFIHFSFHHYTVYFTVYIMLLLPCMVCGDLTRRNHIAGRWKDLRTRARALTRARGRNKVEATSRMAHPSFARPHLGKQTRRAKKLKHEKLWRSGTLHWHHREKGNVAKN